jgi:BON domain
MRTVRIERPHRDHPWLWLATGAVVGVAIGVLIADKRSGRRSSLRGLAGRTRRLAGAAMRQWGPLLETVGSLKEWWDAPEAEEDEIEESAAESETDDEDEGTEDDDGDGEDEEAQDEEGLDARVLEAFSNDPVLASRAVEIDSPRDGVIVLYGRVRSDREVRHAVTIARGVPGVVRVRERLTVRERSR